jgi:hypothetical protein
LGREAHPAPGESDVEPLGVLIHLIQLIPRILVRHSQLFFDPIREIGPVSAICATD